jgi:Fe-S oxidoreductase
VREANESVIIAPGTSCREQISGGTGRLPQHPAVYLASRLDGYA